MMGIRWGNGIPSALRGTTAVYTNGYAARCVKPAVFPRRCSITLRHLPSDFSISTTDLFEAAYILGHHPNCKQRRSASPHDFLIFLGRPLADVFYADTRPPVAGAVRIAIHRKPHTVLRRLAVQKRTVFGDAPCLKLSVDGYSE